MVLRKKASVLLACITVVVLLASGVALAKTLEGTENADTLVGTPGSDNIFGAGGPPLPLLASIHPITWKRDSRKSNCRVLHRTRPDRPGIAAVGTPASGLFLMFDLAPYRGSYIRRQQS